MGECPTVSCGLLIRTLDGAIGGSLEIQSSPGAGTTIAGSAPLLVDLPQHQAPTTTVDDVIPV
jgi:hypothetical protein